MTGKTRPTGKLRKLQDIIADAMGIVRTGSGLENGLALLATLRTEPVSALPRHSGETLAEEDLLDLGEAMMRSALARTESRGAHCRADYPDRNDDEFQKTIITKKTGDKLTIRLAEIGEEHT